MTISRILLCALSFAVLCIVTSNGHVESDGASLPDIMDLAKDAMIRNLYYKEDSANILAETTVAPTAPVDEGLTTTQELFVYSTIAYVGLTLWSFLCLLYIVWAANHTKLARDEMEEIK